MTKFITKLTNKNKINNKIIIAAADFETLILNNKHYVFAIGFKIKNTYKFLYINKNLNENNIINNSYLLIYNFIMEFSITNNKTYIYFHNLGGFDGIFILKAIEIHSKKNDKFESIIRNNRIYKIIFNNIIFLDSMLLLNDNLDNLAKTLLNRSKIEINYNLMNTYKSCIENKTEILNYLYHDVDILYQLIIELREKIYQIFNVDIIKNFTIPSIAMHIYRKDYLKDDKIYIPNDPEYNFIKKSYKGGITNIIIPEMNNGYIYDINSLYPYIMMEKKMPIGKPTFIYNNIDINDINKYFGFIHCIIYIPENTKIPPLVERINNTLVQAVGIIEGTFFSEEIINSITKYKCKLIKIYTICHFEHKEILFTEYIKNMYSNRINSTNKIENLIYKLLMNSLYGRFGINKDSTKTKIIYENEQWLYDIVYKIENIFESTKIVTYTSDYEHIINISNNLELLDLDKEKKNIIKKEINKLLFERDRMISAVQIASAISAYSRIEFINHIYDHLNDGGNIYYYDTDSIHTDKPLNKNKISNNIIGKFKLEDKIKKAYYLSPKIYCIQKENNELIIKFKGLRKNLTLSMDLKWFKNNLKKDSSMSINYIRHISKKLYNLCINSTTVEYSTEFKTEKYIKVYDKNNKWIHNKWICINKK